MHRIGRELRRTVARATVLGLLVVAGAVAALVRPSESAAGQEPAPAGPPPPGTQDAPAAKEEENGGEIVFHVISKTQKFSVLYSHELHLAKGIACDECHEKTFKKKLNDNHFKMADINRGQFCGICHTENPGPEIKHPAFAPKKNCAKCHTLRVRDEK